MPVSINCTLKADVVAGSSALATHQLTLQAYDLLTVDVTAGNSATVEVQPGAAGQVQLLFITSDVYDDTDLFYEVDGSGTSVVLDAPLLLLGTGGASLLGAIQEIAFTNNTAEDAAIQVLVGRNAT